MSNINEAQEKSRQIQDKHKKYADIERQARISELEMLVKQNKFPCNTLELQQYLMNRTAELEREE